MSKRLAATAAATVFSVALHVVLGWAWTAAAGIAAGLWVGKRGWLVGMVAVAAGWAVLVGYSFAVAPAATREMTRLFGGLMGNLPPAATVAGTVFVGALLGFLGGLLGSFLSAAVRDDGTRTFA